MAEHHAFDPRRLPHQDALTALELFCQSAKISFDQTAAARALHEAARAIPGDDWPTWSQRLVEVGESVHLRIRSIESGLQDALTFVASGTPVVTCVQDPDGRLRWFLLAETRGRRVRLVDTDDVGNDSWLSLAALRRQLGLTKKRAECRWIIGQPALSCEPPARDAADQGSHQHLRPLTRLIGLLRPRNKTSG